MEQNTGKSNGAIIGAIVIIVIIAILVAGGIFLSRKESGSSVNTVDDLATTESVEMENQAELDALSDSTAVADIEADLDVATDLADLEAELDALDAELQ